MYRYITPSQQPQGSAMLTRTDSRVCCVRLEKYFEWYSDESSTAPTATRRRRGAARRGKKTTPQQSLLLCVG